MTRCLWSLLLLLLWTPAACDGQTARRPESSLAVERLSSREPVAAGSGFARLVARLSEPGGFFDTDNLISNETSYLHVLGKMREMGVNGGAYIGVGPDQNFSYIAQIRPGIAFIIDIRRDNLLQHLMFKALFTIADTRAEYLGLLLGLMPPAAPAFGNMDITELIDHFDAATPDAAWAAAARAAVQQQAAAFGVPLSAADLETIGRFHDSFIQQGLGLRFQSFGRAPQPYYPTFRQLLLETDLTGRQASYLATEDAFQFVKQLQTQDRIIPVVGDLAGDHALPEVGRVIAERGERVSAFYTSNVEFYLMREGSFPRFAATVATLPRDERSVIIRSYFNRPWGAHPQAVPGYASTQLLQTVDSFAEQAASGNPGGYWELVTEGLLELR